MKLAGLQKLTLLDFPGELACTVFTQGCNMRCPFCQNADLVLPDRFAENAQIPEEEFFRFLEGRKGRLGGVAITGGEPTLHSDLPDFMRKIREMGFRVKLDTNGTNPGMLKQIVGEGLADYVAMDVKNTMAKYPLTVGIPDAEQQMLEKIRESIAFLMEDTVPYEFRTTVVGGLHTAEDIEDMARQLQGAKAWYLQQFRSGDNLVGFPGDAGMGRDTGAMQDTGAGKTAGTGQDAVDACRDTGTDQVAVDAENTAGRGLSLESPSGQLLLQMRDAARRYVPSAEVRGI